MATATADAADVLVLLADGEALVADVLKGVSELALAQAWARGEVEFGRRNHCVTGRPGVAASNPTLVLEDGVSWTGPKTPRHKPLKGVLADAARVPDCTDWKQYVKEVSQGKDDRGFEHWRVVADVPEGQEFRWTTARVTKAEAVAALALRARLTDKGLAAMG
jgi:hypothetical protein